MSTAPPAPSQAPPHPAQPLLEFVGALLTAIFSRSWLWRFLPGARAVAEQMRQLSQDFTTLMEHLLTLPPAADPPTADSTPMTAAPAPTPKRPTPKRAARPRKPRAPSAPAPTPPASQRTPPPAYPRASAPHHPPRPLHQPHIPRFIFARAVSPAGNYALFVTIS